MFREKVKPDVEEILFRCPVKQVKSVYTGKTKITEIIVSEEEFERLTDDSHLRKLLKKWFVIIVDKLKGDNYNVNEKGSQL